ncbi:hypothetical protein BDN71DRAFT_1513489 [Pleurotus eryngii]|uniref:Uncharacterized protein n=1 Tax=Pleurotus eryngii TaxID=5323 RepID=A0A9P5ZKE2_PLEER|nr:hypothetical protein BDN71DRAFT_1513489 [Pleurotus eryngii]
MHSLQWRFQALVRNNCGHDLGWLNTQHIVWRTYELANVAYMTLKLHFPGEQWTMDKILFAPVRGADIQSPVYNLNAISFTVHIAMDAFTTSDDLATILLELEPTAAHDTSQPQDDFGGVPLDEDHPSQIITWCTIA